MVKEKTVVFKLNRSTHLKSTILKELLGGSHSKIIETALDYLGHHGCKPDGTPLRDDYIIKLERRKK